MSAFLDRAFLGNSVRDWLFAAAAFLVIFTVLPLVRGFVLSRRAKLEALGRGAAGVELALLLISRTSQLFLWIVALFFAGRFLESTSRIEQASKLLIVIVTWFQVARWGTTAVRFALERQQLKHEAAGDAGFRGSIGIVMFVANLAIFSVAILLALDNLGVNITALVAGLGVGGIAIALAVQTILGDLLASLSITLDKPFTVGDVLRIDDVEGRVEKIGVKSTRMRSVSGEQVIVANADLLKARIRNLGRMAYGDALAFGGLAGTAINNFDRNHGNLLDVVDDRKTCRRNLDRRREVQIRCNFPIALHEFLNSSVKGALTLFSIGFGRLIKIRARELLPAAQNFRRAFPALGFTALR